MTAKGGLLGAIKSDVERTGSNRGKFFYVKSGAKARVRFLEDMDDGRIIHWHDRWDPQLKVPCMKNFDEDADCPYCDMEGVRTRDMYAWAVWDYDANEVKIFMQPANQCTAVPGLVALYETYGTIIDRDFSIGRSGSGTGTTYSVIPLDKTKFRNEKAKAPDDKKFWKMLKDAYPYDAPTEEHDDEDDEEEAPPPKKGKARPAPEKPAAKKPVKKDEKPWDDEDEDEEDKYEDLSARELYNKCKERDIEVKPRMEPPYYIKKLKKWDEENEGEDDDFWGDDDE